jgi:Domain of unknown function (DUF4124)
MRSALIVAAMLAAGTASAQPYKCTNEEGKTVYSDQRCDATPKKVPEASKTPEAKKDGRYVPTAAEAARIKSLEREAEKPGVTSEHKTALLLEASAIRSGADARMSAEDRSKRDIIYAQLTSKNVDTRTQALADLRTLYGRLD